ncbi:MAG: SusC/RagA family TonB-linked outer membrane protein, partial [Parafilimonas sp.]|nr:SusC/RagA family TonB-linked outer membrane protein [Parafilimonas sp.]
VVSAVNFGLQEVHVTGTEPLTVHLKTAEQTLNEVVVTALGIKREKRSLGYSTQTVNSDQLNKSGTGNILNELNGKASGLTVINSSGDPGAGTYIRLRGVTSVSGDNQPLIVVDGIPLDNSINSYEPDNGVGFIASGAGGASIGGATATNRGLDINPNDIESVTLLKGPAATALYGIQAASGALIITTKKGNAGPRATHVNVSSSAAFDKVSQLPALQTQFSQGTNGNYMGPETGQPFSWGAAIDTLYWNGDNTYPWDKHGAIVGKSDPSAKMPVVPYDTYGFFVTGMTFDNNVAFSANNEKGSFRMSFGNLYQTGVIPKSKYVKNSFSLSGQSQLTDKLSASASINYINSDNNKIQQGSQTSGLMLGLSRTTPTFDNTNGLGDAAADNPAAYTFPDGRQRTYRGFGGYDNPYWTVNRNPYTSELDRVFGVGQVNYQVLSWMGLSYRLGGDVYTQNDKLAYDIHSTNFPAGNIYLISYANKQFNSDFTINMNKQFNDLNASLIVGHNYFTNIANTNFTNGNGLVLQNFLDISNATAFTATEFKGVKRTMAFYADAELNYKKMLYLTLTGRQETTSTLAPDNNKFFYPSVSAGWVFTEMPAFQNNVLSYGKLRASFAQVGKDAPIYSLNTPFISPATFTDGYTVGLTYPLDGVAGSQISSATTVVGNPDLRPENTFSYEGGFDLGFLKDRFSLSATAYYSNSKDVIITSQVPYSSGFAARLVNAAQITNRGLELTLNTTPVKTSYGLRWDVNLNWSTNKNKVVKLAPGLQQIRLGGFGGGEAEVDAFAGQPYGVLYGATAAHANLNDIHSPFLIDDEKTDASGDPNPSYGQLISGAVGPAQIIGDINPKWLGSAISNLSYKGFTFSFQIDVREGGDIYNGTVGALVARGLSAKTANRGTPTVFQGLLGHLNNNGEVVHFDKDGVTELPGPGAPNTIQSQYDQNYWQFAGNSVNGGQEIDIEDGSFVRVRQVSLTYQLPSTLFKKRSNNISLTLFANNPFLWTKYNGVDPETSLGGPANGQGLDFFNNPGTKTYGVRLNLGL